MAVYKNMETIPKGTVVFVTMKSNAVYKGTFQWYKPIGGGRIMLSDVTPIDMYGNYIISGSNQKDNRKFWVTKIKLVEAEDV